MKRVYWRPPGVSQRALALIALLAVLLLVAVESLKVERQQPWHADKLQAARLAQQAMAVIRAEKERLGHRVDPEADPTGSGMIGEAISPVTANTGYLSAKQRTVDPNWAAVVVHLLRRAGVQKDDLVAVGVSGSFPALNVATYAALAVLGARPVIIASVSASEWGANHVDYLWVDMERTLNEKGVLPFRSVAGSRGGIDDRAYGLSKDGRAMLDAAIARAGIASLEATSLADAIEKRMRIYDEAAQGASYRAYINVGGGTASVGTSVGKKQFKPGLNRELPRDASFVDSVMVRFARRDVPVVHFSSIETLATEFGMPPLVGTSPPALGEGQVYSRREYRRWLAAVGVAALLGTLLAFIRLDLGFRLLRGASTGGGKPDTGSHPEPMI